MKNKILIIDDEINIGLLLTKFLIKNRFEVFAATTGASALEILEREKFDLILCDYRLEDTNGKEILIYAKENYPATGVVIITGYSDIKLAVELIKLGAYDYIVKPLYPDEILSTINKALETQKVLKKQSSIVSVKETEISDYPKYIEGKSKSSLNLLEQINLVAPTNYSIILNGKSGTGKECVAKIIHQNSLRKNEPFVAMDCGSLSKELAASEFFGHEKGSFTGAMFTKVGHFEQANGGTLFLDEIANLSYEVQAILLRAVQERKIRRIGSTKEIALDMRIIIATNENLEDCIQKGTFREDLYHRFNEFSINIPSLSERKEDIMLFANAFLTEANEELNKNITSFSKEVKSRFLNYSWPGNVRELKNVIKRIALLTNGKQIETKVLPLEIEKNIPAKNRVFEKKFSNLESDANNNVQQLRKTTEVAEYAAILTVLKEVNFNKTKAAKILKIDRKTLYNKISTLKLDKEE
ncbi:sigma-54-dependent transcriptional regulator [Pedobacter sp. UBA5917]|jgi:two-component system response regulator HydG|uniref:sigma-54-dependent transcriptional regulator n=1 Tax=Pedobacter sp. UBA5917 TaxID=1947061 RepID=UPI0025E5552B|nr:sigma-54 dependent transcriptional regulator [Pedobacter sp. UBA5917]